MENKFKYRHIEDLKGHQSGIYDLVQGEEPNELISVGGDGVIHSWMLDTHTVYKILGSVKEVIFKIKKSSVKGQYLLGTMNGNIYLFDRDEGILSKIEGAHPSGVFDIIFLHDHLFATIGGDGMLKTWDFPSMNPVHEVHVSDVKLRSMDINKELGHIAIAAIDGSISVLDSKNLKRLLRFRAHDRGVYLVRYHPHKKMLISGCIDGVLNFWKTDQDYRHIYSQHAHSSTIYDFDHHKWDNMYVTVSKDKSVNIWDPGFDGPERIHFVSGGGHQHSVNSVCWLLNGTLATAGDDKVIKLWDVEEAH